MINPIAAVLIALGGLLMLCGAFLMVRHAKVAGLVILLLGFGVAATPWLVSFFLAT